MFKLILQNPLFAFATQSANLSKYIIKNNAYLIEAPPKRPVAGYTIFSAEKTKGSKGIVTTKSKELANEWKQAKEIQEKYNQIAKEKSTEYSEKKKQY